MLKEIVIDLLDYLRYQVVNDRCTPDELKSIYRITVENLKVDATVEDIAKHYGQKESNVRNAISRMPLQKPKRRVYHNLCDIQKYLPKTWRRTVSRRNIAI